MNKQLLLAALFVQLAHASNLTVQQALQVPTHEEISSALKARGGTYTKKAGQEIQTCMHTILRGNQESFTPIKIVEPSYTKEIADLLSKSITALPKYLPPASYSTLMKGLVSSWQTVHSSIALKKHLMKTEDAELASSPLLKTAQHFAQEAVLNLLIIIYSPKAHP